MSINILSAGLPGIHSFKIVNVNSEDNYIYLKDGNIPSAIIDGASYIYADGTGSIEGLGSGSLVYALIETEQIFKLVDDQENDLDITGSTDGSISLNEPIVFDNKLNINISTPSNQAVKYFTIGDPLTGLTSGDTYFLKNVSAEFTGTQALYEITNNTHTFTACGQTGRVGPNSSQILAGYSTNWHGQFLRQGAFQGYQDWTVPVSGIYEFDVQGAAGFNGSNGTPGRGARVRGRVNLTKGETITIVVGQVGEISSGTAVGGSGGGTFVVRRAGNEPLFVAGGGSANASSANGRDGQTTTRGGVGSSGRPGGEDGFGGPASNPTTTILNQQGRSGGGGGFSSRGEDAIFSRPNTGATLTSPGGGGFNDGLTASSGSGGFGGGASGNV